MVKYGTIVLPNWALNKQTKAIWSCMQLSKNKRFLWGPQYRSVFCVQVVRCSKPPFYLVSPRMKWKHLLYILNLKQTWPAVLGWRVRATNTTPWHCILYYLHNNLDCVSMQRRWHPDHTHSLWASNPEDVSVMESQSISELQFQTTHFIQIRTITQ